MARARPVVGLDPRAPFADAAVRVLDVRAAELFAHAEHVLDVSDIERVHAMRVATRRLRAVLEVFASCFPKARHRRVLAEVKALADALGARRDPDVQISALQDVIAHAAPTDAEAVAGLVAGLRAEQDAGNVRLSRALERMREQGLREQLTALGEHVR